MDKITVGLESILNTYHDYVGCIKCSLCSNRITKDISSGFGSATADIMIITDAPSSEDMVNNELLSDADGRFLMNLLEMVWYEDDQKMDTLRDLHGDYYFESVRDYLSKHIFFTSMVACPTPENVKVTKLQAETCRNRVHELIYAIDPLIVISLGDVPGKYLFGTSGKVATLRGMVKDFTVPSQFSSRELRYAGMVIYHPKVLGRIGDQNLVEKKQGLTYETMLDLQKALHIVKKHKELQCQ